MSKSEILHEIQVTAIHRQNILKRFSAMDQFEIEKMFKDTILINELKHELGIKKEICMAGANQ